MQSRLPKLLALGACALAASLPGHGQISLYTAADLTLRNSQEVKMAEAEVNRAAAGVSQTRDAYLPSFSLGSSVGYSYGFPVGQPSVYNVSASSLVFSFSQPEYIRSARASLAAAQASLKDTRQKVLADLTTDYVELDADNRELQALMQQHDYGQKLIAIVQDRVQAGFASQMDETSAELQNAQLDLHRIHLQNHAKLLAARIAHLTGLPQENISTETQSIPKPPLFVGGENAEGNMDQQALSASFAMQASDAEARSKYFVARGDEHQSYRPEVAFGIQYSRYAKFNNYELYYLRFQHNNFDAGINITLPLFDAIRRDKARASAADAVHARAQASQYRLQLSEQVLELKSSLDELAAQQKVAGLQSEYAREQLESVSTQLQSGGAANGATLTPKDEQLARIEERRRFAESIEADLQLQETQVNLLRTLGHLEDWVRQPPQP